MKSLVEYLFSDNNRIKLPYIDTTFEEFCDMNNINIDDNIDKEIIDIFYYHKKEYLHVSNPKGKFLENIEESLKSHSTKKLALKLNSILNNHGEVKFIDTDKPNVCILVFNDEYLLKSDSLLTYELSDTPETSKIYDILKFFNYYISYIEKQSNKIIAYIEPLYSENLTNKFKNKIFYHVTSKQNWFKIKSSGLRPKVGKTLIQGGYRYFPSKLFLIADSNNIENDLQEIIKSKMLKDYVIIKIDLTNHNIGIYKDDYYDSDNIVYTYEAIPPELLTKLNN